MGKLEELVRRYSLNKTELDSYKKLCDADNKEIKTLMKEEGLDCIKVDNYIAKYSTQVRESLNEERLLMLLQDNEALLPPGLIKVRSYVDMDVLESCLYNELLSPELVNSLSTCKEEKIVEVLKISKVKGEK